MSSLKSIFSVFSNRENAGNRNHDISEKTRERILVWCTELFANSRNDAHLFMGSGTGYDDYRVTFWGEICRRVVYRTGEAQYLQTTNTPRAVIEYLHSCKGPAFLDFLEDIFRVDCYRSVQLPVNVVLDELNQLLRLDNLPYYVTDFVTETTQEGRSTCIRTIEYPKVILKENDVAHANIIAPALALLQKPHFANANREYLSALEDYRHNEIGDCLTKCGSTFESVLKVICDRKGWPYSSTDSAAKLLDTVLSRTRLDGYFSQPLILIATLRNRLSTAHGAGTTVKQPAKHIAQFALNATASAVILLAQEAGEY